MSKNDELVEKLKAAYDHLNSDLPPGDWVEPLLARRTLFNNIAVPGNVMALVEERERLIKLLKECIEMNLEYNATVIGEWGLEVTEALNLNKRIQEELLC